MTLHPGLQAHPSGCVWHPDTRTLFAADLHLGYAWAQRRRGELAPLVAGETEARLRAALAELAPRELVLLGDIVHAPRPAPEEWVAIQAALGEFGRAVERLTLVAGNHDRGFAWPTADAWRSGGLLAVHGHRLPEAAERESSLCLYGHWHPAVSLRDAAGARHRLRAFLVSDRAIVLPALSAFAAGLDVRKPWPADLREALGEGAARVWVTTGQSLKGPLALPARRAR